jgi:hypothetical protein
MCGIEFTIYNKTNLVNKIILSQSMDNAQGHYYGIGHSLVQVKKMGSDLLWFIHSIALYLIIFCKAMNHSTHGMIISEPIQK